MGCGHSPERSRRYVSVAKVPFVELRRISDRFYIILQGAVNIYRLDDESSKPIDVDLDTIAKLADLDGDPERRELLIGQTFGNYVVTLGKDHLIENGWRGERSGEF